MFMRKEGSHLEGREKKAEAEVLQHLAIQGVVCEPASLASPAEIVRKADSLGSIPDVLYQSAILQDPR